MPPGHPAGRTRAGDSAPAAPRTARGDGAQVPRGGHGQPEGGPGDTAPLLPLRLGARPALPAAGILPAAAVCPECLLRAASAPARLPRDSPAARDRDRGHKGLGRPRHGLSPSSAHHISQRGLAPRPALPHHGLSCPRRWESAACCHPGQEIAAAVGQDQPGPPRAPPGHPLGTPWAPTEPSPARLGCPTATSGPVPSPTGDSDPAPRVAVSQRVPSPSEGPAPTPSPSWGTPAAPQEPADPSRPQHSPGGPTAGTASPPPRRRDPVTGPQSPGRARPLSQRGDRESHPRNA
ncbi:uncharacterized protein [Sylvia atricapilla]|uniref:uncharacterized protein n=1 Tax=Sylvia atricapilla TaxID=48155 RepID=UPI003392D9D6